jgi:hypothetical protein
MIENCTGNKTEKKDSRGILISFGVSSPLGLGTQRIVFDTKHLNQIRPRSYIPHTSDDVQRNVDGEKSVLSDKRRFCTVKTR